jgi:hypothetical protein
VTAKRFKATLICGVALGVFLVASGTTPRLGPGTAGARSGTKTVVTSHPHSGGGYTLEVTAFPGNRNYIRVRNCIGPNDPSGCTIRDKTAVIRDTGPLLSEDSTKCTQETPSHVLCKLQGLRRVKVDTRDRIDGVSLTGLRPKETSCAVTLGRGSDSARIVRPCTVHGNRGDDGLTGRAGNQRLFGGRNSDKITAGRGRHDYCNGQRGHDNRGWGCNTRVSLTFNPPVPH